MSLIGIVKSSNCGSIVDNIVKELLEREVFRFLEVQICEDDLDKLIDCDVVICFGFRLHLSVTENIFSKLLHATSVGCHILFWTHESFWDHQSNSGYFQFGRFFHHMNCYTGDVFTSEKSFYFGEYGKFWADSSKCKVERPSKDFLFNRFNSEKRKKVCAYATRFDDVYFNNQPHSLTQTRNKLIEYLHSKGCCSVFGNGWESKLGVPINSTRSGVENRSWGAVKLEESSASFSFSVCLENSVIKHYVTEKISHSLEAWLIPIYCFDNDLKGFDTSAAINISKDMSNADLEAVYDTVVNMGFEEYFDRLSTLIENYNAHLVSRDKLKEHRLQPIIRIEQKIGYLISRITL
ncbi:hypothetical protein GTQ48_11965 [Alteromonas genovensis]|uniref:Fucosyltransferase C-terminal domain-containing protein n=1 Tax=Alteromonas genovensis TaxID=471225 RepID=A0A6N9TJG1_9ALTE|nr:glycosyltransferase family 10 [Alteromonas genovensis]NDW16235.1 hypothetical protein [Alteromonas genovensis]